MTTQSAFTTKPEIALLSRFKKRQLLKQLTYHLAVIEKTGAANYQGNDKRKTFWYRPFELFSVSDVKSFITTFLLS